MKDALLFTFVFMLVHCPTNCQEQETNDKGELGTKKSTCGFRIQPTWKSNLRGSPIVSTPILYDIDMDGYSDVIVTTVTGEVWAIHGESGHIIDNWPFYLEGKSFLSSPLVYDIDHDGTNEIVAVTSDAEVVFVHREGFIAYGETIKLPPLKADRNWHMLSLEEQTKLLHELGDSLKPVHGVSKGPPKVTMPPEEEIPEADVHKVRYSRKSDPLYSHHQPEERRSGLSQSDSNKVFVDPHILATPIIIDSNGDGLRDEMILPISYYFDPYHYGNPANLRKLNLPKEELKNFVAGSLVNVNLTDGRIVWQKFLGLTQSNSDQPGFLLSSPTSVMLEGHSNSDILVATVKGEVHFLTGFEGKEREGFPIPVDSVTIPVAVGDVDIDGIPDIIVCDNSGNVQCLDLKGRPRWEQKLDSPAVGIRFGDVDGDNDMDLVLTTKDGTIHTLSALRGVARKDATNIGVELLVPPLLTGVQHGGKEPTKVIAVPSSPFQGRSSSIFFLDARQNCMVKQEVEIGSYSSILQGDLLPHDPGYEFLVSLEDGTLHCYRFIEEGVSLVGNRSNVWDSEVPLGNEFTHKSQSIYIVPYSPSQRVSEVTKREFDLKFDIVFGGLSPPPSVYYIEVSMGNHHVLHKEKVNVGKGSDQFSVSITVASPHGPAVGHIELRVCTTTNICDNIFYNMRFNVHFEENLKWCLAVPFVCLCLSILWFVRAEKGPIGNLPTTGLGQSSQAGTRKNI
jgi:hypothetical protein